MNYIKESEWRDFDVTLDGVKITGIRGLSYKEADEDEPLHAAGHNPVGIQSGNTTYEGELKALKNEVDAMIIAAKAAGYESIKDVPNLVIVAAYKPKGQRALRTDILTGVKISELPYGWDQGAKFMEISLPFKFLEIKRG
ncbi:MAG: hypothetical protein IPG85_09780 [Bacteroidetes bacterium]|nr:hypothetical protein [Bacteroidota bacterium]